MPDWNEVLLKAQCYALTAGGAAVIALAFWLRKRRSGLFLPLHRAPRAPWPDAVDFMFFLFLFYFVPMLVLQILEVFGVFSWLQVPAEPVVRRLLWALPFALPFIVLRALAMSRYRHDVEARHLGLTCARWRQNVALGTVVFLVATPLISALHLELLVHFPPKDHGFLALVKSGISPWEWGLLSFLVLIFAPVGEEIMARGFLAPLEEAPRTHHLGMITVMVLLGLMFIDDGPRQYGPLMAAMVMAAMYAGVLQWEGSRHAQAQGAADLESRTWEEESLAAEKALEQRLLLLRKPGSVPMPISAIIGSASFFAILHSGEWPAPIPLFFFALVCGWMAWRTRSLVGPMVFHCLFNLVSLLELIGTACGLAPK